jgi:transposase
MLRHSVLRSWQQDTSVHGTPIHGRRVGVLLERKRYKCRGCSKTFSQDCSDINDNHRATNRLVEYVENNALDRTFTSVADEIGVTEGTVRKIVGSYIEKLEEKYQFESPEILGIDEVHLNRKMRLVFTNIGENTILDLVSSRKKQGVLLIGFFVRGGGRCNKSVNIGHKYSPYYWVEDDY